MTKQFLTDTAERVVRTFAQALLAFWGADALNVLNADWGEALSVAAGAALVALLTCVAAIKFGHSGTASLTTAVEPAGLLPSQRTPGPDHAA